ncbi:MAG: hypothetical protein ACRDTD_24200, partial [Pseudonocardiaceae bacterium]
REPCNTASRSAAAAGSIDSLSRSSAGVTVTSIRRAATAGYATCDHGVGRGVLPALGTGRRATLAAEQPEQPEQPEQLWRDTAAGVGSATVPAH